MTNTNLARESDDAYHDVVARPSDRWRVITCNGGIQWIVQTRRGAEWRHVHYCRTREALLRLCDASCGDLDPSVRAVLRSLPEQTGLSIGGEGESATYAPASL